MLYINYFSIQNSLGCYREIFNDNNNKQQHSCPGRVAQLVGASSVYQKVAGLIPGQDTSLGCRFNPRPGPVPEMAGFSLSHGCFSPSLLPSLKSINIS